ncbi:hypothetical protein ACLKA6_008653 [Drosophila palustris]
MPTVAEQSYFIIELLKSIIRSAAAEDIDATTIDDKSPKERKLWRHKQIQDHVRGGVITICGHLYCWTCLWPKLYRRSRPRCPRCGRRLILHEDIIPFLSEGPYTCPDNGVVLAQPRNVPRPTGMYLQIYQYPNFNINDIFRLWNRVCIETSNLQGQMPRVLTTDDELLSGLK